MLDFGGVPIASIRLVYFPTFTIKNQPFMILTWILRDMIFLRDVCWFVQSVHPWKLIYPLKIDGWKMKLPFYSGFFSGDIRSFCGVGGGAEVYFEILSFWDVHTRRFRGELLCSVEASELLFITERPQLNLFIGTEVVAVLKAVQTESLGKHP